MNPTSVVAPTPIRMFDYRAQLATMRAEIMTAVAEVLDSGQLVLGPRVRQFEQSFAHWLGAKSGGVGVGNGTDALALALRAVGVGPGEEVITVANTAIPTVSAIRMIGATPVFADVRDDTLLMDLDDVARRITPRTRAIVPVHLFGNAVPLGPLLELAQAYKLRVVEDCAQATGTRWNGQHVGTFGDVGCFSFYPTKNLGAYGDGGFCLARDEEVAERLRRLRFYGCGQTYYAEEEGVNSRLDELHAAMLEVKLRYLDAWIAQRQAIAARYDALFADTIRRPTTAPDTEHSYHLYVMRTAQRDAVINALREAQMGHGIHYPTPIHQMRGYAFLGWKAGSLPNTERAAGEILSLPCYPELTLAEVDQVAACVLNSAV